MNTCTDFHHGIRHAGPNMHTMVSAMSRQTQRDFAELQLDFPVNDADICFARRYSMPAAVAQVMSEDEKSRVEDAYFSDMHAHVSTPHLCTGKHKSWAVQLVRKLLPKLNQSEYPALRRGKTN